jgi:hypothetical protein
VCSYRFSSKSTSRTVLRNMHGGGKDGDNKPVWLELGALHVVATVILAPRRGLRRCAGRLGLAAAQRCGARSAAAARAGRADDVLTAMRRRMC